MSIWSDWAFDPAVATGLAGSAVLYGVGLRRLWRTGRGRGASPMRAGAFFAGLAGLFVALVSPLDAGAEHLLSAHMVQHLLLLAVAPPLLILGRPVLVGVQGLPQDFDATRSGWGAVPLSGAVAHRITNPVLAWLLQVVVVWGWHVPRAYEDALANPGVHALEHASFLAVAFLFWWPALEPGEGRRLPRGADVLYLLTAWLQSGALGALFALAPTPIYGLYAARALAHGGSALADQRIAGLIMWIPGGLVYLGAACAMFVAWLRATERTMQRLEGRARVGVGP